MAVDALIMTCGTGGGHNAAARAMKEELERRGHSARVLNPYTLHSEALARRIDSTYVSMAQRAPDLFGAVYSLGNAYRRLPFRSPVYHVNSGMARLLRQELAEHPCDVVLCTHLFPAEIITGMKRRGMAVPPCIFIATDYACIPFTEETDCDAYVIPAADLAGDFVRRGLPQARLHPLGIPVSAAFETDVSRDEARRELGLEKDGRLALVSGGSMGASQIGAIARCLREHAVNWQAAVVCGSNRHLQEEMTAGFGSDFRILGQTDRMALYMRACDVYITKPGGLSSTEAACTGVPLVHMAPIPGCETLNRRYFTSRGMSLPLDSPEEELMPLLSRLTEAGEAAAMVRSQREHLPRGAAGRIADLAGTLAHAR